MPRLSNAYQAVLRSCVDSEKLCAVPWPAEALYFRLLLVSDGYGRYRGDAHYVACHAAGERLHGPHATSTKEIETLLAALVGAGLITRYGTIQGSRETFLQVVGYFDAGNRQRSSYPPPPGDKTPLAGDSSPPVGDSHPLAGDGKRQSEGQGEGQVPQEARKGESRPLLGDGVYRRDPGRPPDRGSGISNKIGSSTRADTRETPAEVESALTEGAAAADAALVPEAEAEPWTVVEELAEPTLVDAEVVEPDDIEELPDPVALVAQAVEERRAASAVESPGSVVEEAPRPAEPAPLVPPGDPDPRMAARDSGVDTAGSGSAGSGHGPDAEQPAASPEVEAPEPGRGVVGVAGAEGGAGTEPDARLTAREHVHALHRSGLVPANFKPEATDLLASDAWYGGGDHDRVRGALADAIERAERGKSPVALFRTILRNDTAHSKEATVRGSRKDDPRLKRWEGLDGVADAETKATRGMKLHLAEAGKLKAAGDEEGAAAHRAKAAEWQAALVAHRATHNRLDEGRAKA